MSQCLSGGYQLGKSSSDYIRQTNIERLNKVSLEILPRDALSQNLKVYMGK